MTYLQSFMEIEFNCDQRDKLSPKSLKLGPHFVWWIYYFESTFFLFHDRYNAIRHLDKPRYDFPLVVKLLFEHNYIDVIGDDAFSTGVLEYLDLSHNKITGELFIILKWFSFLNNYVYGWIAQFFDSSPSFRYPTFIIYF